MAYQRHEFAPLGHNLPPAGPEAINGEGFIAAIRRTLGEGCAAIAAWDRHRHEEEEIQHLNAHMLADLGLRRAPVRPLTDIEGETRRY